MYDLTVDQAHTFYVGEGQWLVHNAGGCGPNIKTPKEIEADEALRAEWGKQFREGQCKECAESMHQTFKDKIHLGLNKKGLGNELLGPGGQNIGAPRGYHLWTESSDTKIAYDIFGRRGPIDVFNQGIRDANQGNVSIISSNSWDVIYNALTKFYYP